MRNHSKTSLLVTIAHVIKVHDNNWCYATQSKLIELLAQHHQVDIKQRQLNYHLRDLRDAGFIKTIKRTRREEDGTLTLMSSATCLTIKGCLRLFQLGMAWALRHLKKLKALLKNPNRKGRRSPALLTRIMSGRGDTTQHITIDPRKQGVNPNFLT